MKPTNEEIIGILKDYDEFICAQNGTNDIASDYVVTHREDIPGEDCEFVQVRYTSKEKSEFHPSETSVLVYGDCTIFVTEDWDFSPMDIYSIDEYNWICANNAFSGILLNGLPRLLM